MFRMNYKERLEKIEPKLDNIFFKIFATLTVGYFVVSMLLFGLPFIIAYGLLVEYPHNGWVIFWNYWNILSICISVIGSIIGLILER